MTENQLKNGIGVFLIVANFLIILLIFLLYALGGFLPDEMNSTIALVLPMFSVYTVAIVKYIISNKKRTKDKSRQVTNAYVFISWLFPSLFVLLLAAIILAKSFNFVVTSFSQFRSMMLLIETIFGAYIGIIISSMFKTKT